MNENVFFLPLAHQVNVSLAIRKRVFLSFSESDGDNALLRISFTGLQGSVPAFLSAAAACTQVISSRQIREVEKNRAYFILNVSGIMFR